MGYIHDFDVKLSGMLSELPEGVRREVVAFVKSVVIESFRNGIDTGRLAAAGTKRGGKEAPTSTPEKEGVPHE
jgi:hypothetical protein